MESNVADEIKSNCVEIGTYENWDQISVSKFHADLMPHVFQPNLYADIVGDGLAEFYSTTACGDVKLMLDNDNLVVRYETKYISQQLMDDGVTEVRKTAETHFVQR